VFLLSPSGRVVPECIKNDSVSPWKSGKFDPVPPKKNPKPIVSKICMGDYVADLCPYAKFHNDPITPLRRSRLVFWGCFRQRTAKTTAPIFTINSQMQRCPQDVKSQDRDETVNVQDRDETETFHFPKLSRPRLDETFNLQDRDETRRSKKTYRDRLETETFKTETTSLVK